MRKICIAVIGVFGTSMGQMQVHSCLLFLIIVLLITMLKQPFGGNSAHLLSTFEITSLCATIFMLWAASVFNTYPRCEAGDGTSKTLVWCDFIAVLSGGFGIIVAAALLLFIIAFKVINPVADGLQKSGKLMSSWRQHVSHRVSRFIFGKDIPGHRRVPSAANASVQEELEKYRASLQETLHEIESPLSHAASMKRVRKKTTNSSNKYTRGSTVTL